jgi:hypothetical protein
VTPWATASDTTRLTFACGRNSAGRVHTCAEILHVEVDIHTTPLLNPTTAANHDRAHWSNEMKHGQKKETDASGTGSLQREASGSKSQRDKKIHEAAQELAIAQVAEARYRAETHRGGYCDTETLNEFIATTAAAEAKLAAANHE